MNHPFQPCVDFSLEIIGLEGVRIVNADSSPQSNIFHFINCQLTLKNLLIYVYRAEHGYQSGGILLDSRDRGFSKLFVTDVRMHGAFPAIRAPADSQIEVVRSTFADCPLGFFVRKTNAKFVECVWKNVGYCKTTYNSSLSMSKSSVIVTKQFGFDISGNVRAQFNHCEFKAGTPKPMNGINAARGAQVTVKNCTFSGFETPLYFGDFHTNAVVRNSKFFDCITAVSSHMNSNVTLMDCELDVHIVLVLTMHFRSKIKFERNSIGETECGVAQFNTDGDPKHIKHDFEHARFHALPKIKYKPYGHGATSKSRSEFKGKLTQWAEMFGGDFVPVGAQGVVSSKVRICEYCDRIPEDGGGDFKYCTICRVCCYCSKECQVAHWKDHKLLCANR